MSDWKPIETAPRDGRWILVGIPENPRKQFRMYWDQGFYQNRKWRGEHCNWSEGPHGPTHWKEIAP